MVGWIRFINSVISFHEHLRPSLCPALLGTCVYKASGTPSLEGQAVVNLYREIYKGQVAEKGEWVEGQLYHKGWGKSSNSWVLTSKESRRPRNIWGSCHAVVSLWCIVINHYNLKLKTLMGMKIEVMIWLLKAKQHLFSFCILSAKLIFTVQMQKRTRPFTELVLQSI